MRYVLRQERNIAIKECGAVRYRQHRLQRETAYSCGRGEIGRRGSRNRAYAVAKLVGALCGGVYARTRDKVGIVGKGNDSNICMRIKAQLRNVAL